jgi:hypothetical protein
MFLTAFCPRPFHKDQKVLVLVLGKSHPDSHYTHLTRTQLAHLSPVLELNLLGTSLVSILVCILS